MLSVCVETISKKINLQKKVLRNKYIYNVTPPTVYNYYQLWRNESFKNRSNNYKYIFLLLKYKDN